MTTFNRAIEASINCGGFAFKEGEWNFELSPPELPLGYIASDCYKMGHALRFLNIDIPPGQVIKNAYITYRAWSSYDGDDCYGHIYGEKSLTPLPFSTWDDFDARPKTTNRIPWDKIPHWQSLTFHTTPNFSSVIQEIISQPGWVSGNPIALFCDDIEDRSSHVPNAYRKSWAYYEHFEWAPVLTIEYGPETQIAVLDIAYVHFSDFVVITLPTQIPCHLTCFYTHIKPVRHATSRVVRGVALPWGAYWCFAAWNSVEQIEAGDTLTHTFEVPDWSYCQTKWFTFRGTTIDIASPSVGPLFEHHHPGVPIIKVFIARTSDGDIRTVTPIYSYIAAHDGTRAKVIDTADTWRLGQEYSAFVYIIYRVGLFFDTSEIPDDAQIGSATLTYRVYKKYGPPDDIVIVNPADLSEPLQQHHYHDLLDDTESLGSAPAAAAYFWQHIPLNDLGLAKINKQGITKLALRSSKDIAAIAPTGWEHQEARSAETRIKPYLTVTYQP